MQANNGSYYQSAVRGMETVKNFVSYVAKKSLEDGSTIKTTGVALLAIGALIGGGVLLHVNAMAAHSLLGFGGVLLGGTVIAGVMVCLDLNEEMRDALAPCTQREGRTGADFLKDSYSTDYSDFSDFGD